MGEITIYGASDDLLEVRGDIRTEKYPPQDYRLLFTDGTLLKLHYDWGWNIEVEETGEDTTYELYSNGSEKAESIMGREGSDVIKLFNPDNFTKAFIIDEVKEVVKDE